MKEVYLNNYSLPTLVDDEDYNSVCMYNWTANIAEGKVQSVVRYGADGKNIFLHREIIQAPDNYEVDHIDSNPLNNQKDNLRLATRAQQCQNRSKIPGCSSQYKGVCWVGGRRQWWSRIRVEGKLLYLGYFPKDQEKRAAFYYDVAALHFFGSFAKLNFPEYIDDYLEAIDQLKLCGKL